MLKYGCGKKEIRIGDKTINFDYDILEVEEIGDIVLVVTEPVSGYNNNLFGISVKTKRMWQVQSVKEMYPDFSQTSYVGITISDNAVIVTDFCGCRFVINPENGVVLGRTTETK